MKKIISIITLLCIGSLGSYAQITLEEPLTAPQIPVTPITRPIPIQNVSGPYVIGPSSTGATLLLGRKSGEASIKSSNQSSGQLIIDSQFSKYVSVNHYTKDNVLLAHGGGNVGIGIALPQEKLHINGNIRGNGPGGALRIKTASGYMDIGAQNTSWAHIYTDLPKIIFNKDVYTVTNAFSSHNNDLIFKTKGVERLRVDDVNGNVGIGTNSPQEKLDVNGKTVVNSLKIDGVNSINSVNGFRNRIELVGQYHSAIVHRPGNAKELMFGFHDNGYFHWGTGGSATKPNFYSMRLNGNTGDLYTSGWLRPSGTAGVVFQTYGGGFHMTDTNWIRTYGNKNFYHNKGVMRTDGQLQVGPNGNRFIVKDNGNVGVGTTNPSRLFEIRQKEDPNSDQGLVITEPNNDQKVFLHLANNNSGQYGYLSLGGQTSLRGNGKPSYFEGVVGIGTTDTKGYKLGVNGKIAATEVKIALYNDWPDYVFTDEYVLPTLEQVEQHIVEKGHLPNIPAAAEVAENGILLGEMNAKLLEKIEELTLYTIEQQKKLKSQEERLVKLEALLLKK